MTDQLRILRPDDWHLHLRDGEVLRDSVPAAAEHFARVIVMPNLKPPVRTLADALAYRERILEQAPADNAFEPLMTLYLTDSTTPDDIRQAAENSAIAGVKLYPAGATTNSDAGVRSPEALEAVFETLQEVDLPLLIHGEVTDPDVDTFDREAVFIERFLAPLTERLPALRVVLEHITTTEAADFVRNARPGVAATITPQHLAWNRNALFAGGLRPHAWCLPVLKRERHRQALIKAATSGSDRFFLGTDSAPHARADKESDCGCAGIYSSPVALAIYAAVFDEAGALDRLENFASQAGPAFYRRPANSDRITLQRDRWTVPDDLPLGNNRVVPMAAGTVLEWRVLPG